jgi:hypothetical protein
MPPKSTYIVGTHKDSNRDLRRRGILFSKTSKKSLAFIIAQQIIVSEQCAEAHWNQAHPTQQKISSNTFGG